MADLTQARARQLFNYDPEMGKLTWRQRDASEFASDADCRTWNTRYVGREAGGIHSQYGYRRIRLGGKEWKAHRIIWVWVYGREPMEYMDHINGVRDDNRLVNLREVDPVENMRNVALKSANSSGVVGVSYREEDHIWRANIGLNGRSLDLGSYRTFEEAFAARKGAEKALGFHPNHGTKRRAYDDA